jgi:hypothetical protein
MSMGEAARRGLLPLFVCRFSFCESVLIWSMSTTAMLQQLGIAEPHLDSTVAKLLDLLTQGE